MKLLQRFDFRLLAIFLLVAGIVHIGATFLTVNDTRASAYARLAHSLPQNTMVITDPIAPNHQPLPFLAPDARFAFCLFDTTDTPIRVRALLPDLGWTIGIYAPDGQNLYFAAASAERETTIDLSIVPADDRFLGLPQAVALPGSTLPPIDHQNSIAAQKGLVVVRAPDKGEPYRGDEKAVLAKASCGSGS
ncbi:hypothetical protein [Hyphomicrobium sp.]|uniref:DUF1254 domain-containing protein n=1 Tax=Hyphomicrobium sp. TaxID=82 RepID=UPI002D76B04B|nr:hypothetical protein [Hyphomicrobium sp.]HET6390774.1 hypothetical protein [Hyphomicrobium sp.]